MFNKEEYWKRRNNTVEKEVPDGDKKKRNGEPKMKKIQVPKPLRGQDGDKISPVQVRPSDAHIGFDMNGQMIVQNRVFRRRRTKLPNNESPKVVPRKMAAYRKRHAKALRAEARKIKLGEV